MKELMVKYHNRPDHALVAYVVPREYMMAHLIADLGEHEAHHGKALASNGKSVPPRRALDLDVLRYPLFIAELKGTNVALAMEVPRRHAWGNIPVPAF
ncbi:MAG: hypothetical protein HYY78_02655 [Betaproteobacteria bacterium]|nr:hypothetical protein [Betaproteobacteria bacterium]